MTACPKCGAGPARVRNGDKHWDCGSPKDGGYQSSGCTHRQRDKLAAREADFERVGNLLLDSAESEGWDHYKGTDEPRGGIAELRLLLGHLKEPTR